MNTWTSLADGRVRPGGRGFYVETREDHLVTSFFEDFSMFAGSLWICEIIRACGISFAGTISDFSWSYSYEEVLSGERRPRIADVVIVWRDDLGKAVLVIEAKRPGFARGGLSAKDEPDKGYYLAYNGFDGIDRRYQALLVDNRDIFRLSAVARTSKLVLTWQDLCSIKSRAVQGLTIGSSLQGELLTRIDVHHAILGLSSSDRTPTTITGTEAAYAKFRSLDIPSEVRDWLIGSELFLAARQPSAMVEPPYAYLVKERTAADWRNDRIQSSAARKSRVWNIR
jgi:hypothetical protein